MEERKNCDLWLWAGLVALALLTWLTFATGKTSAKNLQEGTRGLAQEGLDAGGFTFARAEADGAILRLKGAAPDKATADAACEAANAKVKGQIGLPGVFARVDCGGIAYPGSDVATKVAEAVPAPAAAIPTAVKAEADTCQARLTEASKTAKIAFARSKGNILSGQEMLDGIATIAMQCQKFSIEVGGHTDTGGAAELNQRLSEERAKAVRAYLISKGVDGAQLTAKGYGETKPLFNDFPNGNADVPGQPDSPLRAQNRRTEFTITALN